jgi:hypothetical protein
VEGVQLPSPFLLGSNALATAAAPASPIWLSAVKKAKRAEESIMIGEGEGVTDTLGSLGRIDDQN